MERYFNTLQNNKIDGLDLIKNIISLSLNQFFNNVTITNYIHKEYLLFYFYTMVSPYTPKLCIPSYYCLQGVATNKPSIYKKISPQICLPGFYCSKGAGTMAGTGFCPLGYFCPEGTEYPILTPPGTFTNA
jgi:hypothetical protein